MSLRFPTWALVALLCSSAPSVRADQGGDAEITRMAKEYYKLGLDAFKAGQYPEAVKNLKKAYLLRRLPVLLLNIAKTYGKMDDLDNEIHFYRKFLAEAPADTDGRDAAKTALAAAEQKKRGGPPPEEPAETPPEEQHRATPSEPAAEPPPPSHPPRGSGGWSHTPLDAVPPGHAVDVRLTMPVSKGVKVFLAYRGAGDPEFERVEMKRFGAEKVGRIPADVVSGKTIQYFIEAKGRGGVVVKHFGSADAPNLVMIDPEAHPQLLAGFHPPETEERAARAAPAEPAEPEPPVDEAAAPRRRKNIDEEEAPLSRPPERTPVAGKRGGSARGGTRTSGMAIAGYSLLGLGVVVAGVGAPVSFYYSGQFAKAVTNDSFPNAGCCENNRAWVFDDPLAKGANDAFYQQRGHLSQYIGFGAIGLGGALAITGAVLVVVDRFSHPGSAPQKKRHAAPVEPPKDAPAEPPKDAPAEPPKDAPAEPPAEPPADPPAVPPTSRAEPRIRDFIAAPTVSPNGVGLAAGFRF